MSTISIQSRAMWGSSAYYAPTKTVFDCGFGTIAMLRDKLFSVSQVVIGHQDHDHIGDLISLIGLRAKVPGRNPKPLTVYYPEGSFRIERYIRLISEEYPSLPYELTFDRITPGHSADLGGGYTLHAFETKHRVGTPSLGYRIERAKRELLSKLKSQIVDGKIEGVPIGEYLNKLRTEGRHTHVIVQERLFAYLLDSWWYPVEEIRYCKDVVCDCTFLIDEDRKNDDPAHGTLSEAISVCHQAKVKRLIASHVSLRYSIEQQIEAQTSSNLLDIDVQVVSTDGICVYE